MNHGVADLVDTADLRKRRFVESILGVKLGVGLFVLVLLILARLVIVFMVLARVVSVLLVFLVMVVLQACQLDLGGFRPTLGRGIRYEQSRSSTERLEGFIDRFALLVGVRLVLEADHIHRRHLQLDGDVLALDNYVEDPVTVLVRILMACPLLACIRSKWKQRECS